MATGQVTAGCYASGYEDCDGGSLTREHYISRSLLRVVQGDDLGLLVDGLTWADGSRVSVEGDLTARILCSRHNGALSELDSACVAWYAALRAAAACPPVQLALDGTLLERWALKVLVGVSVGGVVLVNGHRPRVAPQEVPRALLDVVFGHRQLRPPKGFYLLTAPGDGGGLKLKVIAPTEGPAEGVAFGIKFQMQNVPFAIWLGEDSPPEGQAIYRPDVLDFGDRGRFDLKWPAERNGGVVRIDPQ